MSYQRRIQELNSREYDSASWLDAMYIGRQADAQLASCNAEIARLKQALAEAETELGRLGTMEIEFGFDGESKPIAIVLRGSMRDLQLLEARMKFWHRLESIDAARLTPKDKPLEAADPLDAPAATSEGMT